MEPKGFISSLFDISFSSFVTPKIIKVIFVLSLIAVGIWCLFFIVAGFAESSALGVVFLVLSPLFFLLGAILTRVYMETLIVMFKIAENTGQTASNTAGGLSGARGNGAPIASVSPSQRLLELDALRQSNSVSEEEYARRRREILDSL